MNTNNLLLNISLPMISEKFDFIVPRAMTVSESVHLILQAVNEEYPALVSDSNSVYLFDVNSGMQLPGNLSYIELNILNGTELILI